MSFISNLTLALSVFKDSDIYAATISKEHAKFYHIYYKKDGKTRVMLVPKEIVPVDQLQYEVNILLSRNIAEQAKVGVLDGADRV